MSNNFNATAPKILYDKIDPIESINESNNHFDPKEVAGLTGSSSNQEVSSNAFVPTSIRGSRVSEAAVNKDLTLPQWLASICPFIDFDSARFSELCWAIRADHNLSTVTRIKHFSSNTTANTNEIFDFLRDKYKIHYESDHTFRTFQEDPKVKGVLGLYLIAGKSNGTPIIIATGDKELVDEVINPISERYNEPSVITIEELSNFSKDGPITSTIEMVEGKVSKVGHDAFYPFLKLKDDTPFSIKEFAKRYKESSSNILLLIGDVGLGKSVLLKALMMELGFKKNGVANGNNTTMNPQFIEWLKDFKDNSIVVIEDAHDLVLSRDEGNAQMSNVLNYAEGITSRNNKLVISTNLTDTSKVDRALLRAGRCYDVLEFRELRGEEINAARTAIGLDAIEVTEAAQMSLAKALNFEETTERHKPSGGVGF
ncbi:MAG: ATP-binding protein [Gammaproteobacteria bacterium]|nr:ATP-binding protein [Acholeplasmataceae bacterium]MCK9529076.1 ATP-binding protein [Gammaproteobacteria bacterium]